MLRLGTVLAIPASVLMLAAAVPPDLNPLIDSAYARDGGGGNGGGNGGGHGGGHGGGVGGGQGHGLAGGDHGPGLGHGSGRAPGVGQGKGQGHGAATSAAARSDETTGLAKAMAVVASTPAAIAGALGLDKAFANHEDRDLNDHPHD
ncbi:hypothetical protein [Pseudomonas sp. SO81]|uniref:hypothetical protein n=1 Tax=Pseudomonas sp. SO81 TaxID=2983246 RepID=UPI0025A437CE|nr:hypothetical protein [Pseudomonas sp. SO81]WJN61243.1 hypothetical protein OH686_21050 [Pseudomonas sp. SO81]